MIKEAIDKLARKEDLSLAEARGVFSQVMDGKLTPAQTAALLMGLRAKGETPLEMRALVEIMRTKSLKLKVRTKRAEIVFDTCGTGGKKIKTFNISTAAAFVIAALGVKVAKHGNRSFSGVCGSADVLEAAGLNLSVSPKVVERAVKKLGIGFLYAPLYHSAMRNVASVRREMGVRTIFNIVGPLTNPANASHQLMGVYDKDLTEKVAAVLRDLGTKRAYVVWAEGLGDEVSIIGPTKVTEVRNKKLRTFYLTPSDLGLKKSKLAQIRGTSVKDNLNALISVLSGKPSAKLDAVIASAACCLVICGKAKSFKPAAKMARVAIKSGAALRKFRQLKGFLKNA
ncbi:anthranilate phosphoribosyltransferase [Candidatus Omnitrophota bacterium]